MSRIAKTDVHAALTRAAEIIRASDTNKNGRYSRAEVKAQLASMPEGTEKALVDIFYKFADHRDHKAYAKLTEKDLAKTLEYSFNTLVNAYDKNNNGLSKAEIARMSTTAQLAVKLSQELKATPAVEPATSGAEVVAWN